MSTIKVDTINTRTGSGDITFSRPIVADISSVTGTLPMARLSGTLPALNGSALTALNATQLTSGTVPDARFPATLPAKSGANLTNLNATNLASGTLPMARLSGTLPALNGSALTNLPSTPIRNFIIDGDFTQWPEGDRTNAGNGQYGSALFSVLKYGTSAVFDIKQSTDVPTVAQSNHLSKTSMHVDCTTADTSVAAADYFILAYHITGYDYAHLHGQEVTFATWVKSDITGVYSVAFRGTVGGRTYGTSFTISSADTWEYKTITLTLDTSDASYNFDEGKGLDIYISLIAGSNYNFSSPGSWQAEGKLTAPNQVNFGSADTNDFRMAQTGLYLGASAPTFTSPAISTVKNQVDYYIQRLDFDDGGDMMIQAGVTDAVGSGRIVINLASSMRISPTITSSAANTFLWFEGDFTNQAPSAVSFSGISQTFFRLTASLSSAAVGAGFLRRDGTDTSWIMADARH